MGEERVMGRRGKARVSFPCTVRFVLFHNTSELFNFVGQVEEWGDYWSGSVPTSVLRARIVLDHLKMGSELFVHRELQAPCIRFHNAWVMHAESVKDARLKDPRFVEIHALPPELQAAWRDLEPLLHKVLEPFVEAEYRRLNKLPPNLKLARA